MAETILRQMRFPERASLLAIDASNATITRSEGDSSHDIQKQGNALSWTQSETADEIRFLRTDGNAILYQALLGATHPGARILQITALPKGTYMLRIDGKALRRHWTDVELASGIDLQMEDTPAHKSGVSLYYACSNAELDQTNRSRLLGMLEDADSQMMSPGRIFFDAAMERSVKQIMKSSERIDRRMELMPIVSAPIRQSHTAGRSVSEGAR